MSTGPGDTRDIAIRADESSKAAHKRLDGINGQIARLSESHEGMREDLNSANVALVEKVADMGATLRTTLKVAGALCALAVSITAGVAVYAVTQHHERVPSQAHVPAAHVAAQSH